MEGIGSLLVLSVVCFSVLNAFQIIRMIKVKKVYRCMGIEVVGVHIKYEGTVKSK